MEHATKILRGWPTDAPGVAGRVPVSAKALPSHEGWPTSSHWKASSTGVGGTTVPPVSVVATGGAATNGVAGGCRVTPAGAVNPAGSFAGPGPAIVAERLQAL